MATAVPLKPAALVGAGLFGDRVVEILARELTSNSVTVDDPEHAFTGGFSAVVVALWRPSPALCEQADQLAHDAGVPWLPIVMEHPVIRVGPWVVPGAGPCFRCFGDRRIQHDRQGLETRVLHAAYDRDATLSPSGFLPFHARLTAGIAASLLGREDAETGRVITLSLVRRSVSADRVIARPGCDRCGRKPSGHDLRDVLRITRTESTCA